MSVKIELPWPPTVNNYWVSRVVTPRKGKPFVAVAIGKPGRQFRTDVQAIIWHRFGILKPSEARVSVSITAHPPDRRDRDIDNILKALNDALTHAGVWRDDSQIDRLSIERGVVRSPGCVVVEIERIPQPKTLL